MNTFLPYADFKKSAQSLDYKRLGKQRVETWQILNALRGQTKGWVNHPASKMWRGHEKLLCEYGITVCDEWIARGYNDTMRERFVSLSAELPACDKPFWFTIKQIHISHQSNLKRKDPKYYAFDVPADLPYIWADTQTHELIVGKTPTN